MRSPTFGHTAAAESANALLNVLGVVAVLETLYLGVHHAQLFVGVFGTERERNVTTQGKQTKGGPNKLQIE